MDGKSEWVRHVNVTLGGVPQMWTLKNGRKLLSFFVIIFNVNFFSSSVVAILSSLKPAITSIIIVVGLTKQRINLRGTGPG